MEIFKVKHLNLGEETLILLKAHTGQDTYPAAEDRQLWSSLQMLPRKRKIHAHKFKLHIFSAEEGSKRDFFESIKILGRLFLAKALNQSQRK